jgi:hypothetical protein
MSLDSIAPRTSDVTISEIGNFGTSLLVAQANDNKSSGSNTTVSGRDTGSTTELTPQQKSDANKWLNEKLGTNLPVTSAPSNGVTKTQTTAEQKSSVQEKIKGQIEIATLIADTANAQSIASTSGNQAGVVFTTAIMGVLETIKSSGGKNAGDTIEKAASGLGKTTKEFLKLVGEGDVAAFGVVIGDLGGVLNGLQGGQPGKLLSSSMSTVGDTIRAFGVSQNDKYQQFVGTVISGVGSLLSGLNSGQTDGGLPPGLALAGGIATSLANLSGDKGIATLGTALTGASSIADYFNTSQSLLAQGTIAGTVGNVVGGLIGGADGQKVSIGGDLVNNAFAFAANSVPGAASGNVLSIGLDALQLLGVKIDPGVTSIGSLAASVLSGPVGWVNAGIQIIGSLFNMGDHNKDVTLQENINATGRILKDSTDKSTDKVSVLDHTNIGFLNIGSSHSSTIQYDVSGVNVDPRLLNKVDYSITPETYTTKRAVEIGTSGRSQTPNGTGIATLDDGTRISGKIVNTYPPGSEEYSFESYVAPTSTKFVADDGRQFDMVGQAMGRPGSAMSYRLVVPTGNYVAKVDASYNSINSTVGGANGTVTWVLKPADADVYIKAFGGNVGSFTAADTTKVAYAKSFTDHMSLRFKGVENDPTYVYYADVNADKVPDMISIELNMNGLEKKGDGSVTVTLLDKDRNAIGQPVVSNGSSNISENLQAAGTKVADMLKTEQLRPLLTLYAAAHPEIWDGGKDYTSVYKTLSSNGTLAKLQEAQSVNTQLAQSIVTPGADVGSLVTKLQGLVSELKLDFNPAAYAKANPDVAAAVGNDSTKLAEHYIQAGNNEGRSIKADGTKLDTYVPPILRGFTSLGASITNGQIEQGQALVSSNGQFAAKMQSDGNFVVYNTATGAATWSSNTQKQDHSGFLGIGGWSDPPGKRVAMQSDGNLVVYADNNQARWSSDTYSKSANRSFKLTMQDDGNLVVYDSQSGPANWVNSENGPALWASSGGKQQSAADNNGLAGMFTLLARNEIALGDRVTRPTAG